MPGIAVGMGKPDTSPARRGQQSSRKLSGMPKWRSWNGCSQLLGLLKREAKCFGGFDESKTAGLHRLRVFVDSPLLALSAYASVSVAPGFLQFPFQRTGAN